VTLTLDEAEKAKALAHQYESHFTLKGFQAECLEKFEDYRDIPNVLIADEMGLGKTVEAIALDQQRRLSIRTLKGKTLVIAPLSVVDVWRAHYEWMLPNVKVTAYDPVGKQPAKARAEFLDAITRSDSHIYVVHWDALRLMPELAEVRWFNIIADEAHRAKNRKAQQTRALKKIPSLFKMACTGTPAETRPHDIWSVLNWLYPKQFRSYWTFFKNYVITKPTPEGYSIIIGVKNVDHLQASIKKFYIRRLKQDVLKDLPEKTYSKVTVKLPPKQRKAYDQMKNDMLAWVGEHEDQPVAAPAAIAKLCRLQQFAIASCELIDAWKTITLDAQQAEVKNRHTSDGIVYKAGDKIKKPIKLVKMVDPSSKLDAVMQIIEDNPDESFVVFSQFKQVINLLGDRLVHKHISHGLYTGDTDKPDRDRIVREFQAGERRVFAGTIRAGGEGITLTRASTVIFIDRDWSPSKNRQAEDRCHRVGQPNAVQIIDIIAANTVDRGRHQKIAESWKWIKELLGDK
jgi:SNF2 family DNA or RNA helicase